ncbi:MAG: FkbM family methyltransferase [Bacteroidia bacterium]
MQLIKNTLYALADLLTFYKGIPRNVNGFKVRFAPKWSRFYESDYEKDTFDFFRNNIRKGDTILDIGAHIGLYSSPLAELCGDTGKVFCFEPTPGTFSILKQTIRLNKQENVKAIHAAISDKSGTIGFNLTSSDGKGSNANSIVETDRAQNSIEVPAFSIDDFRKQNRLTINVLKIDVEGAELSALLGAKETFLCDRPCGILALHPANIRSFGHSLAEIWDCLQHYQLQVTYKGKTIDADFFCKQELLFDVEFKPV